MLSAIAGAVVAVALLAWALRGVHFSEVMAHLRNARPVLLLAAALVASGPWIGWWGVIPLVIAMLAFSIAWLALAHLFVLLYEEPTLERRFGASYDDYRRRVPRWIPRF